MVSERIEEEMKRILTLLGSSLAMIVCIFISYTLIQYVYDINLRIELSREATTPLPSDTIDDLCYKFEITEDSLCNHEKDVYAPDFYRIIRNSINRGMTFDEVSMLIGDFETGDCSSGINEGLDTFSCSYDLRGDFVFYFSIFFDGNGIVGDSFYPNISWKFSN